jgi:hypothetical protein
VIAPDLRIAAGRLCHSRRSRRIVSRITSGFLPTFDELQRDARPRHHISIPDPVARPNPVPATMPK